MTRLAARALVGSGLLILGLGLCGRTAEKLPTPTEVEIQSFTGQKRTQVAMPGDW